METRPPDILRLYNTFQDTRCEKDLIEKCAGDDYRVPPILLHSSRSRIPFDDLAKFGWYMASHHEWCSDCFRFLLPRICELLDSKEETGHTIFLFDGLRLASFNTWKELERTAFLDFCIEHLRRVLEAPIDESKTLRYPLAFISGLGMVIGDISRFLDLWTTNNCKWAIIRLAACIEQCGCESIATNGTMPCFDSCSGDPTWKHQIKEWLLQPLWLNRMEETFFRDPTGPFADSLSMADFLLQIFHRKQLAAQQSGNQ